MTTILKISALVFIFLATTRCAVVHVKDRTEEKTVKTRPELFSARKGNELKKRLVVLPFLNISSYTNSTIAATAREDFLKELAKDEDLIILDWKAAGVTDLDKFQEGNTYKLEDIAKRVRAAGVHAIIVGTIKDLRTGKSGDSVGLFRRVKAQVKGEVEMQVISARSGKVMASDNKDANSTETFTRVAERSFSDSDILDSPEAVQLVIDKAFEKTIPVLVDSLKKFSWEGRVALVKQEKVYLNAGRLSGLQIGDVLRIVEGMEEVFDPETSHSLGTIKGRMKGTVEVVSYFGNDGAVTLIHSGSGFKENDLVEFY
jgi:TolB-like protein